MPICQWILISFMLLFALDAAADARRITEYGYDNSGDINIVDTGTSDQPPLVTELLPSTVRIGQQHNVIANGAGLRKVQIDADASGLSISRTSSDSSQAIFTLNVGDQVTPGEHTLRFSTPLGFTTQAVTVYPPLPTITLNPAPIVLPFPSSPIELDIQLSSEDIIEHALNLTVDDPAVAELLITSTTIATGQTRPGTTIIITGLQKGVTTLNISSQTLGNYSTRTFVTDPYMPAIGGHTAFANPLGIILQQTVSPPPLPVRGPFSTELGILKSQSDPVDEISIKPLLSQSLILAKGAVLFNVSHSALIADGSIIEITITGVGLENVDNVEIAPPDGITIGPLTVAPDGTRVSFTVEVDAGVDIGTRKIILTQQGNEILTTRLTAASITIAQGLPAIETIDPIVVSRLSNNALIVRGSHFQTARTLSITPADGITISSPLSVNAQGA